MSNEVNKEDFSFYRLSILNDIKRIGNTLEKLQSVVMDIALAIEQLKATDKIRSALWGGSGGVATTAIVILLVKSIWGITE